jgi:hypothetical protein
MTGGGTAQSNIKGRILSSQRRGLAKESRSFVRFLKCKSLPAKEKRLCLLAK